MTLCDAGPLFALVDPRQAELHERCKAALPQLSSPIVTSWPSFTEAMYLCFRSGGWPMQSLLWRFVREAVLVFEELSRADTDRAAALMEQYRNAPMDLADASLVVIAERLDVSKIFTLDHHFRIYRLKGSQAFILIP